MKIKRAFAGFLSAMLISVCGIGFFIPKEKVRAAENKEGIIEYFGNDFRYEISFRDNISIIMVYNDDDIFSYDDVIRYPDHCDYHWHEDIRGIAIRSSFDQHSAYDIKFFRDRWEKLTETNGRVGTLVFFGKSDKITINGTSLKEIEKEYGYKDDLLLLDIDDNGQVNILDAQMLLTYILEVQMESYEYSDEGFYQFKEDYLNERKVINEE